MPYRQARESPKGFLEGRFLSFEDRIVPYRQARESPKGFLEGRFLGFEDRIVPYRQARESPKGFLEGRISWLGQAKRRPLKVSRGKGTSWTGGKANDLRISEAGGRGRQRHLASFKATSKGTPQLSATTKPQGKCRGETLVEDLPCGLLNSGAS